MWCIVSPTPKVFPIWTLALGASFHIDVIASSFTDDISIVPCEPSLACGYNLFDII